MARQLGSVVFPESMQWVNERDWVPVATSVSRTIGGAIVFWSQALTGGRPIVLEAQDDVTWLPLATVQALHALASAPGAVHQLTWDAQVFSVMFNQGEDRAINLRPIWPHHDQHVGQINLISL